MFLTSIFHIRLRRHWDLVRSALHKIFWWVVFQAIHAGIYHCAWTQIARNSRLRVSNEKLKLRRVKGKIRLALFQCKFSPSVFRPCCANGIFVDFWLTKYKSSPISSTMATYYRLRQQPASKYIVHPHYTSDNEISNEAIGHQVSISASYLILLSGSKLKLSFRQILKFDTWMYRRHLAFNAVFVNLTRTSTNIFFMGRKYDSKFKQIFSFWAFLIIVEAIYSSFQIIFLI